MDKSVNQDKESEGMVMLMLLDTSRYGKGTKKTAGK